MIKILILLIFSASFINIYSEEKKIILQDDDFMISIIPDNMGYHAVIRVIGYSSINHGAADKENDLLSFVITECSAQVKEFLINKKRVKENNNSGNIILYIAIPHKIDPQHHVKKSNSNSKIVLVINITGDHNVGGWDNTNVVMLYQDLKEIEKEYIKEYTDFEYAHYYDGL